MPADGEDDVLEPVSLEGRGSSGNTPVAAHRFGWGGLLVVLLAGWSAGLFLWLGREDPPSEQIVSVEAQETPAPDPVSPVEVPPTPPPRATVPPAPVPTVSVPVLTLRSSPSGATVLLNGSFVGTTPLELKEWQEGQVLHFRKAGFVPVRRELPPEGGSAEWEVNLPEESAGILLTGDLEGAVIRVDDEVVTLRADGYLALPLTESSLRVEKPGFDIWERRITPAKAYQREVQVVLIPESAARTESKPGVPAAREEKIVTNSLGLELLRPELPIEIRMGAPRGTPGRKSHEGVRKIRLSRPFRISMTEITNEQFAQFDSSHSSGSAGAIHLSAPGQPVVNVAWEQAAQFCNWLSVQEGLPPAYVEEGGRYRFDPEPGVGYRLPTEAEWEGLLRKSAGSSLYAWGDSLPPPSGSVNISGEESRGAVQTVLPEYRDPWRGPSPVTALPPGSGGIRGMVGNVREWVHDGFSAPPPGQGTALLPVYEGQPQVQSARGQDHQPLRAGVAVPEQGGVAVQDGVGAHPAAVGTPAG